MGPSMNREAEIATMLMALTLLFSAGLSCTSRPRRLTRTTSAPLRHECDGGCKRHIIDHRMAHSDSAVAYVFGRCD
jgi:hypothetical protein